MSGILNFTAAVGAIANLGRSDPVILGTISLTGMEVPDTMRVGGQQRLAIHNLPGGEKLIDVAGNDEARLELTGRFIGPAALERAQAVEAIRFQGRPVVFSVAGLSWSVFVFEYSYDYTAKGAVIPYRLTLERHDRPANAQPATGKTLSAKVGNNIGTALSAITSAVGDTAQTVNDFTAQLQTVIGQVTPLANLIGIDGPFAAAQNALQQAQVITQAGTDLSAAPDGLATLKANLSAAGDALMTGMGQIQQNIEGIAFDGTPSKSLALKGNLRLQIGAKAAGDAVNLAMRNATTAGGGTQGNPLVYAATQGWNLVRGIFTSPKSLTGSG